MKTPILTDTFDRLMKGDYELLIPEDGTKLIKMIKHLSLKKIYYPKRIMQAFVRVNYPKEKMQILRKSIILHKLPLKKIKIKYFIKF